MATNADIYSGQRTEAFHIISRIAAQSLDVARASIWFFTEARAAIRCADLYEQQTHRHSSGIELPATAFPRYFAGLNTERSIAADQARTDPRTSEFADSYLAPLGITSMLDVPIRAEGKMVGVICHEHIGSSRQWTLEEEQFAMSVANTVSLVLEAADRRRAEIETERSKNFLNSVIENLPIMVFVKDAEHLRFVQWNKSAEDLTGFMRDTVIGKSDYDFSLRTKQPSSYRRVVKSSSHDAYKISVKNHLPLVTVAPGYSIHAKFPSSMRRAKLNTSWGFLKTLPNRSKVKKPSSRPRKSPRPPV